MKLHLCFPVIAERWVSPDGSAAQSQLHNVHECHHPPAESAYDWYRDRRDGPGPARPESSVQGNSPKREGWQDLMNLWCYNIVNSIQLTASYQQKAGSGLICSDKQCRIHKYICNDLAGCLEWPALYCKLYCLWFQCTSYLAVSFPKGFNL